MKKDLITHFLFFVAFFLLISVVKNWFQPTYIYFWIGGVIGTLIPDADYLIYIYVLRPKEEVSQKATGLIEKKSFVKTWDLLTHTRNEHLDLIFHSAFFQLIFLVFAFLVVTSSSQLGQGMALAIMLHLLIDQVVDFVENGGIKNWFSKFNANLTSSEEKYYIGFQIIILAVLGFVF